MSLGNCSSSSIASSRRLKQVIKACFCQIYHFWVQSTILLLMFSTLSLLYSNWNKLGSCPNQSIQHSLQPNDFIVWGNFCMTNITISDDFLWNNKCWSQAVYSLICSLFLHPFCWKMCWGAIKKQSNFNHHLADSCQFPKNLLIMWWLALSTFICIDVDIWPFDTSRNELRSISLSNRYEPDINDCAVVK